MQGYIHTNGHLGTYKRSRGQSYKAKYDASTCFLGKTYAMNCLIERALCVFCCKNAEAIEYTVGNIENDEINEIDKNDRIDSVDLNVYPCDCV